MTSLDSSVELVRSTSGRDRFDAAVILGSGMGAVAEQASNISILNYLELFGNHIGDFSSLSGHSGRLLVGDIEGRPTLFFQGRFHLYQGLTARQTVLPVELAALLGCRRILLTNAAGGINPDFRPGDFMYISDHLNLQGANPLHGMSGQFHNLNQLYSTKYLKLFLGVVGSGSYRLHEGVYASVMGPSYETPAEVRALQRLGADAVGMSTTAEAIWAKHRNLEVVAVSLISNRAAGTSEDPPNHAEVLASAETAQPVIERICREFVVS